MPKKINHEVEEVKSTSVISAGWLESRKYRLTGLTPILGSQPASEAIRTQFVSSKAPESELSEEERALFAAEQSQSAGVTVFPRDPDNDECLILLDYMVRGFFKSALSAMNAHIGIAASKSKVDKYLFISPRRIPITRDGELIYDEDSYYERPLRAETARGPRVSLVSSECIDAPWQIEIEIKVVFNAATAKSRALNWEVVETALDYGQLSGLGQFRNGSYGTFTWERIDE
jgi:hypothetical protein